MRANTLGVVILCLVLMTAGGVLAKCRQTPPAKAGLSQAAYEREVAALRPQFPPRWADRQKLGLSQTNSFSLAVLARGNED